jgi:hypothetical protein
MPSNEFQNALQKLRDTFLQTARPRLSLRGNNLQAPFDPPAYIAQEVEFRAEVDAACERWIKTGGWPQAKNPKAVLHFWDRVCQGMRLASWLAASGFNSAKSEEELLRFFLIQSWEPVGLRQLHSQLLAPSQGQEGQEF